jgi:hypothetical protein
MGPSVPQLSDWRKGRSQLRVIRVSSPSLTGTGRQSVESLESTAAQQLSRAKATSLPGSRAVRVPAYPGPFALLPLISGLTQTADPTSRARGKPSVLYRIKTGKCLFHCLILPNFCLIQL